MTYQIKQIENEQQLSQVLQICYDILGAQLAENELYCYEAWKNRIKDYSSLLLYAEQEGQVLSLVLGRPENADSLVCGCVACCLQFRRKGITRSLMKEFEKNAQAMGFKYITLGADDNAVGFYEKCGYQQIMEIHGQKIFQKLL